MVRAYVLSGLLLVSGCQGVSWTPPIEAVVPREWIIRFQETMPISERARLATQAGARAVVKLGAGAERWRVSDDQPVRDLNEQTGIKWIQPNYRRHFSLPEQDGLGETGGRLPGEVLRPLAQINAPGDPEYRRQWHLPRCQFPEAWRLTKGRGVIVGVIDSGCDPQHPDLAANLLPLIDEVVAMGGSDVLDEVNYDQRDSHGHGTHVCGIVGAIANNGIGVSGGAPETRILPIKVTPSSGDTDDATIAKGIIDAVDRGCRVLNLSIGGPEPSPMLLEALNYAFERNVVVVIAAGNDGRGVNYPAAYAGVVSVGAIASDNRVTGYSSRGENLVLVAPGGAASGGGTQGIFSTLPTYPCYLSRYDRKPNDYGSLAGTSMAAPVVSAAAALLLSLEPGLTTAQVRTRLAAAAEDSGTLGFDAMYGYGILNTISALTTRDDDGGSN